MIGGTRTLSLPRIRAERSGEVRAVKSSIAFWSEGVPRQILLSLLVAVGYYAGTIAGFKLTPHYVPISTFWPPNAVVLAALLLAPSSMWWMFFVAVLPAHLLIQLRAGVPIATACGWFVSNSGEALLGALCVRYFRRAEELFDNVRGVLAFVAFGAVLAPLMTSFVDAGVVVTTGFGNDYWKLWVTRLFSNMLADLTVAPTIIVLALGWNSRFLRLIRLRMVEGILLVVTIIGVSVIVFGIRDPKIPALMFLPLPLLVWVVVRVGVLGLYPSLLALSVISIWKATGGREPFVLASVPESVMGIQIFLCTIAFPMMLLAAVLAERQAVEESLRQSRARLIEAQEQERRRIARELHDDIGQQLTLLELELDQLRQRPNDALAPSLEKLHRQASAVAASTRTISHGLHSAHLELLGLVPALRNLCETISHETPIGVTFMETGVPERMDPQISLCLYRVTQEALHNVARHSHARKAAVQIRRSGERIFLHVSDDGIGITEEREHAAALGLASMRERVSLVGGTFKIISQPMRGTKVEAIVPLKEGSPGS